MTKCTIGGIIKHNDGYGFKLTFKYPYMAQHYKDMFKWIIKNDNIEVKTVRNQYDRD